MSNSALAKIAKRSLDRVEKQLREVVEDYEGQIFIWDVQSFKELISSFVQDDTITKTLVDMYRTKLKAADSAMLKIKRHRARLINTKADVKKYKIENYDPKRHEIFAVRSYGTVERIKRYIGTQYTQLTGRNSKEITGRVDRGDKLSDVTGEQIGHGEYGSAVSTTKAAMAEAVLGTKTAKKVGSRPENIELYTRLQSRIVSYKKSMGINMELNHVQEVTSRGGIRKTYTPILSSQNAQENLLEGQDERKALQKLRKDLRKDYQDIVNLQGSETLLEAVEAVQLENIIPKGKNTYYNGKAKPRKTVKNKGKGKAKSTKRQNKVVPVITGAGVPNLHKVNPSRNPRSGGSLISLIGIINESLPQIVAKNMKDPRLVNRTGRFAESARITDIIKTPQGFPSVGYTYQKNPYQTFETGNRQGSPDKDPRRLIDFSIREIAAKHAIGRFYTRRV